MPLWPRSPYHRHRIPYARLRRRDRRLLFARFAGVFGAMALLVGWLVLARLAGAVARNIVWLDRDLFRADQKYVAVHHRDGTSLIEDSLKALEEADRVVFLADGTVVDEMFDPTPELVLDRMKTLGG